MTDDDVDARLRAALRTGGAAALADWAATGRPGLLLLRGYLTDVWDAGPIEGTHQRDVIDNTSAAVAAIAAAHPLAFLDVFEDDRFRESGYVLTGLGKIDDPRATERLIRAAGSADQWTRMDVAIGLGRRPSPAATLTLGDLLVDHEYLVRYHALKSLTKIGDDSVLPILRGLKPPSPFEAELVRTAIAAIVGRAAALPPTR
jgi:HEAT repeat protein